MKNKINVIWSVASVGIFALERIIDANPLFEDPSLDNPVPGE